APGFAPVHGLFQYFLVAVGGEGQVERGRLLPARAANVSRTGEQREWRVERAPAPGADRALDGPDRLPTATAEEGQPALRRRATAGGAVGGKDPVQDPIQQVRHGGASLPWTPPSRGRDMHDIHCR